MTFLRTRKVEFNHCDPAGIVFFPRYYEMINSIIEEYFSSHVELSFADMHLEQRKGVPTVNIETSFKTPGKLGETLTFTLDIDKVGRSSALLLLHCYGDEILRFSTANTIVYIDLESGKSEPWPKAILDKLKAS